jgi:hypothetical protein
MNPAGRGTTRTTVARKNESSFFVFNGESESVDCFGAFRFGIGVQSTGASRNAKTKWPFNT